MPTGWSRLRRERAAGGDRAADLAPARNDHGDGRDLARAALQPRRPRRCSAARAHHHARARDDRPATTARDDHLRLRARAVDNHQVSEEWIVVSRFINSLTLSRMRDLLCRGCITPITHRPQHTLRANNIPRHFYQRWHLLRSARWRMYKLFHRLAQGRGRTKGKRDARKLRDHLAGLSSASLPAALPSC